MAVAVQRGALVRVNRENVRDINLLRFVNSKSIRHDQTMNSVANGAAPRCRVGIWYQSITIYEFGEVSSPDVLKQAFWLLNPIHRIGLREIWVSNLLIAGFLRDLVLRGYALSCICGNGRASGSSFITTSYSSIT